MKKLTDEQRASAHRIAEEFEKGLLFLWENGGMLGDIRAFDIESSAGPLVMLWGIVPSIVIDAGFTIQIPPRGSKGRAVQ